MAGEGNAGAPPRVRGARRVGSVDGGVRLSPGGDRAHPGRQPVFERQACVIQMMLNEERCGGLGRTKGGSGLSSFGVKKGAGLRADVLEGEDGSIQVLGIVVRERVAASIRVGVGEHGASKGRLEKPRAGRVVSGKGLGGQSGSSRG